MHKNTFKITVAVQNWKQKKITQSKESANRNVFNFVLKGTSVADIDGLVSVFVMSYRHGLHRHELLPKHFGKEECATVNGISNYCIKSLSMESVVVMIRC